MLEHIIRFPKSKHGVATIAGALIFLLLFSVVMSDVAVYTIQIQNKMTSLDQERLEEKIVVRNPIEGKELGGEVHANTAESNGAVSGVSTVIDAIITFGTNDYVTIAQNEYVQVTSWVTTGFVGEVNSVICSVRYMTPTVYPPGSGTHVEYNYDGQWRATDIVFENKNEWYVASGFLQGVNSWEKIDFLDVRVINNNIRNLRIDRIWVTASMNLLPQTDVTFTIRNEGGNTIHVTAVWILWGESGVEQHQRYNQDVDNTQLWLDVDVYLPPGKRQTLVVFKYDSNLSGYLHQGTVTVKAISERGNVAASKFTFS